MRTYPGVLTNAVRSALRSKHDLMLENLAPRQWKSRARHPGRPRISKELQGLIARIATENPRWGAVRIQRELLALGYEVSAETVRCYRRTPPRPPPSQSWRTFLANHRPQLWAADFFTVQTKSEGARITELDTDRPSHGSPLLCHREDPVID